MKPKPTVHTRKPQPYLPQSTLNPVRYPYTPTLTLSNPGPDLTGRVAHSGKQTLMPILNLTLPFVWGGGIVGPVPTAAVFPPGVQDVGVAVELLLAVAFVHLVVRAA